MSRKRYTPEQIIGMLREAEVCLSQEQTHSLSTGSTFPGVAEPRKRYFGVIGPRLYAPGEVPSKGKK